VKHPRPHRAFESHDPRQARGRLAIGLFGSTVTVAVGPTAYGWGSRLVLGWDVGALLVSVLCWWIILKDTPLQTRMRAAAEDPGRRAVWFIVLFSSAVSLFSATVLLRQARSCPGDARNVEAAICLCAVVIAWVLTHTSYTLRYAHLYYGRERSGGLAFPGEEDPDLVDFAYFAFTIGMCFQASDVAISSRLIRRTALWHSLLSFAYNTTILALALNLLAGIFG
jgi:uncharacterized membrane protein